MGLEAFMALEALRAIGAFLQALGPFVEAFKILRSLDPIISFCAPGNGLIFWARRWGMGSAGRAWGLQGGRGDCKVGVRPIPGAQVFSRTPQYVGPQGELLGWPGGRDRRGAPRFSRRTKKFPPRGRYLPILPY